MSASVRSNTQNMANVHIIFTKGATTAEKWEGTSRAVDDDSLPIRRRHYAVIGAAISVNSSSPACLSFPGPPSSQAFWWSFMVQLILRKIYASFLQVVFR